MTNLRESFYLTWSPDSKTIAALRGPELGKRKLVLIDVATAAERRRQRLLQRLQLLAGRRRLVFARAQREEFPPRSDVFRFPVLSRACQRAGARAGRLTRDHVSCDPLWGPETDRLREAARRRRSAATGRKNELFLMNPKGKGLKRLTHTKVPPLLQGLFPTDWSANGNRLLAEFEGQDTSYAVAVNPKTGAQRPSTSEPARAASSAPISPPTEARARLQRRLRPGLRTTTSQPSPTAAASRRRWSRKPSNRLEPVRRCRFVPGARLDTPQSSSPTWRRIETLSE